MAKRSAPAERRQEILNAAARLYEDKGFRDITIKDISVLTSFSRPSIYNYFQTKEEIFLGLLTREYAQWAADLQKIAASGRAGDPGELAGLIGASLEERAVLLKITAMNLYEIEDKSRLENLRDFKRHFRLAREAFAACLKAALPDISQQKSDKIIYAFFPFMYGIYPYAFPTDKQRQAMEAEGMVVGETSIKQLTEDFLKQVLV